MSWIGAARSLRQNDVAMYTFKAFFAEAHPAGDVITPTASINSVAKH